MFPGAVITCTTSRKMKAVFFSCHIHAGGLSGPRHLGVKAPLARPDLLSERTPGPVERDCGSFRLGMSHRGAACMASSSKTQPHDSCFCCWPSSYSK